MSFEAMTWATKHRGFKSTAPRMVLLMLADEANSEGVSFIGQEKLAWKCEITSRSLRTHLKELETRGLIHRERRSAEWVQGGRKVDAIVLHLEVPGSSERPPGANQDRHHRAETRKRFGIPFEEAPMQTPDVSPSQEQPETISGKEGNRKIGALEPENLRRSDEDALNRNARTDLTHPSIPSPDESEGSDGMDGSDGRTKSTSEQPNDEPIPWSSRTVKGIKLAALRARLGEDLPASVSDDVVAEMIRIALGRAHGPVRSPMGLMIAAIRNDPGHELVSEAEDALGLWQALGEDAAPAGAWSMPPGPRMQTCPVHGLDVPTGAVCPSCRADRLSGAVPAEDVSPESGRQLLAQWRASRGRRDVVGGDR